MRGDERRRLVNKGRSLLRASYPISLGSAAILAIAARRALCKLYADNPAESQVLIPARETDEIDWDMANRLATENRDFLEYVKLVKQFYQTGEARLADWDVPETAD